MISLTLPSIHEQSLRRALRNIDEMTRCFVEVIVVAPFRLDCELRCGEVIWVTEDAPLGCNGAHAAALRHATQDLVAAWVDDHLLVSGWDDVVRTEYSSHVWRAPYCLGLRHAEEKHVGTVFGRYYPYFPVMNLDDARRMWFSGEYRRGFADCDLAMRVWDAGGRCEPSEIGVVLRHADDERKEDDLLESEVHSTSEDMALFLSRWGEKYGAGYDLSRVRGFNRDIRYSEFVESSCAR